MPIGFIRKFSQRCSGVDAALTVSSISIAKECCPGVASIFPPRARCFSKMERRAWTSWTKLVWPMLGRAGIVAATSNPASVAWTPEL